MNFGAASGLVKDAAREWSEDKVPRLGAALAFYTALSIAPLLVIAIAIAGLVFGEEAARGQLLGQMRGLVGAEGAEAIETMLAHARKPSSNLVAGLVGVVTLLVGASGVFGQLQDALNTIWEVRPKPGRGIWGAIKDRLLSLAMVLGVGFLLLVSLILSTVLSARRRSSSLAPN
jgi:membrane protein